MKHIPGLLEQIHYTKQLCTKECISIFTVIIDDDLAFEKIAKKV